MVGYLNLRKTHIVELMRLRILVEFRLIVFRPFKGEIVLGRISSASEVGMKSEFPITPRLKLAC